MSITKLTQNVEVISTLPDAPTQTAAELKAKFDEGSSIIKNYLNNSLIEELEEIIPSTSGAVSTILENNLSSSKAIISDTEGKIAVSSVTAQEISYLSGVTSSVQTQLSSKQNKITYGTQTPSDGSEGDIYIQYGE